MSDAMRELIATCRVCVAGLTDPFSRDFHGVIGEIGYDEGRQVPMKTVWIVEVRGGKRSLAEALVPQFVPEPIVEKP